jgi:hypothetical protein
MLNTASVTMSLRRAREAGKEPRERVEIEMRIATELRATEQGGIVQRGMVQAVGEYGIAAPREGGHDAEVGQVAGREQQRARQLDEGREPLLERVMRGAVAEDEMRGAGPDAVALRALAGSRDERGCAARPR